MLLGVYAAKGLSHAVSSLLLRIPNSVLDTNA